MLSVKGREPFGFYEELRARGPLVRDEVMNAWLVLDYAPCVACIIPTTYRHR
jgi:hypothetical protein